jgi:MFS family permease
LLFAVPLLDELSAGVPGAAAPDIERSMRLSHAAMAAVVFLVPGLVQLFVDPLVFVLADRFGRPRLIRSGLAAMAAASLAAACARPCHAGGCAGGLGRGDRRRGVADPGHADRRVARSPGAHDGALDAALDDR